MCFAVLLRLKFERIKRNWSQTDVALRAGLTQAGVSLIEVGRYVPSPAELNRLGQVFAISPAWVLLKPTSISDPDEIVPGPPA